MGMGVWKIGLVTVGVADLGVMSRLEDGREEYKHREGFENNFTVFYE